MGSQLKPSCQSPQPHTSLKPSHLTAVCNVSVKLWRKVATNSSCFPFRAARITLSDRTWWHHGRFKSINSSRSCSLLLKVSLLNLRSFVTMRLWSPEVVSAKPRHPFFPISDLSFRPSICAPPRLLLHDLWLFSFPTPPQATGESVGTLSAL